jgi:hypothetical protein
MVQGRLCDAALRTATSKGHLHVVVTGDRRTGGDGGHGGALHHNE